MAPNKKYLSLEEAAAQLGIKPDELIRFREKGEVRGFADRGTWKFKADDVAEFHRRRQPDSDPDLPIMDESDDDEELGRQPTVIRRGREAKSDSDVRLSSPDDSKKKQLTGTSDEISVADSQNSDSDVRLVGSTKTKDRDSDSDVKLVKPKTASMSDSDSDVKMVDLPLPEPDSDSDVQLIKPLGASSDSDSDVRLAGSDSDVRLAPLLDGGSDSDVKLIDRKSSKPLLSDSDSDVMLLPRDSKRGVPTDALAKTVDSATGDIDFDLTENDNNASVLQDGDDSSITFSGDSGIRLEGESGIQLSSESGILLAGDSGVRLSGDSGIRLSGLSGIRMGGDSGIRLSDDSGVQLRQPADSGLSLEKLDSDVGLDDSGLSLGEDSGINLMPTGSSKKLKGPSSSKILKGDSSLNLKGGSSKNLKGRSGKKVKADHDDLDTTSPMLLSELDDDGATSPLLSVADSDDLAPAALDLFEDGDTTELSQIEDSGQNVVIFEDDEEDAAPVSSKRKKPTVEESIFESDEANDEELEVSDDDLSEDNELDGMAFDEEGDDHDESFATGSSQLRMGSPQKVSVAQEAEWSAGFCTLLFVSMCVLIVGSVVSADLLRIVWDQSPEPRVYDGVAWLLAGFWKK